MKFEFTEEEETLRSRRGDLFTYMKGSLKFSDSLSNEDWKGDFK